MKSKKSLSKVYLIPVALTLGALGATTGCNDNQNFYTQTPGSSTSALTTPENCTVSKVGSIATISCPDGTSTTISDGQTGVQGEGAGIVSNQIAVGDSRCLQGNGGFEYVTFIDANNNGVYDAGETITSDNYICNGATGAQGATGMAGSSSTVSLTAADAQVCPNGGWNITVTNGSNSPSSYPVCNGAAGATGATGATGPAAPVSALSLVQLIAPCGLASSAWKEELMLFSNGTLLADFSTSASGTDTRLSLIPDGTYQDSDESGCVFTIATSGTTRSISWNAGSSANDPSGWAAGKQSWTVSN